MGHLAGVFEASKNRSRSRVRIVHWAAGGFQINTIWQRKDLEEFLDLLDVTMRKSRQYHELGTGSLYIKLQTELPEMMWASYQRWIFENNQLESVETLRNWIVQEAEFQTIAAETINGMTNQKKEA